MEANSTLDQPDPFLLCLSSLVFGIFQNLNLLLGLPLNVYAVLRVGAGGPDGSAIFPLNGAANNVLFTLQAPLYLLCSCRGLCFVPPALFFMASGLASRFLFQCCVSLERYLAVVRPVAFRRYRDPRYRVITSAAVWTYALALGGMYAVYFRYLPFYIFGLMQSVILAVMVFCCASIRRVLMRGAGPGGGARVDEEAGAFKRRALATVSANLLAFSVQAAPLTAAFCARGMLSAAALALALNVSFQVYVVVGFAQTVFFLCRQGALSRCSEKVLGLNP